MKGTNLKPYENHVRLNK